MTTVRDHDVQTVAGQRSRPQPPPPATGRVALATCARLPEGAGGDVLLAEALAARSIEARWVAWDDPAAAWSGFDAVVVRSTWDYTGRLDEFRSWVLEVAMATTLLNPPRLLLENLHKSYLADMAGAVPTLVVPAGMTLELDRLPWRRVVVKPAVGAGGNGAVRDARQSDLDALTLVGGNAVDAVVQPYLPSVESQGEISIVCVDGTPTHAVRKVPADGEFRAHERRGGATTPEPLTGDLGSVARRALARLPLRPAYARVDVLESGDRLLVGELELVEPYLWLEQAPQAAERLAESVAAHARTTAR